MKEIPQHLIDECEKLALENETTYFIFSKSESNIINVKLRPNKENEREIEIEQIIEDYYHIGTIEDFYDMPSRLSVYDTETKLICRYARYNIVRDLFIKMGFKPSISNVGPEYEQTFLLTIDNEYWLVRLKPNLFLTIRYATDTEYKVSDLEIFSGFFNKNKILKSILDSSESTRSLIREIKVDTILM